MIGLKIGYARVSTDEQDLSSQLAALAELGVGTDRIYVDKGLTGINRARPGLREALAACRAGDQLVVTKLDRLARSVSDAHDIAKELTVREVKLNLGGSIHDPTDAMGKLLFTTLAMIAEFEADLARMRTREGMKIAKAKGRLRGKAPKLSVKQEAHLVALQRPASTPAPSWPSCSAWPARRSIGRSSGPRLWCRQGLPEPGRSTRQRTAPRIRSALSAPTASCVPSCHAALAGRTWKMVLGLARALRYRVPVIDLDAPPRSSPPLRRPQPRFVIAASVMLGLGFLTGEPAERPLRVDTRSVCGPPTVSADNTATPTTLWPSVELTIDSQSGRIISVRCGTP